MPQLPAEPKLGDYQAYVTRLKNERGFADDTLLQECLLLGKEAVNSRRTWTKAP